MRWTMKHDVETNQTRLWGKASVGSAIADWRKRNSFQRIYTKTQIRDHSITQTQANTLGTTSTQTSDSLDTIKTPLSAPKKKKKPTGMPYRIVGAPNVRPPWRRSTCCPSAVHIFSGCLSAPFNVRQTDARKSPTQSRNKK